MLGARLATLHNLHYYLALMARMRDAIAIGSLAAFRAAFHAARQASDAGLSAGASDGC
jgi:queuine tRNA-ribosyltransferase